MGTHCVFEWGDVGEKEFLQRFSAQVQASFGIVDILIHNACLSPVSYTHLEATSGLDPVMRNEILDDFLEFIQDERHTILLSSHITEDLEKVADYIAFLHKGKLVFSSEKDDLLERYGILHCGAKDAQRIDPADIAGKRSNAFGCDILVRDRALCQRKYRGLAVDHATLERCV